MSFSDPLDDANKCVYCTYSTWFTHPKWVYLITDSRVVNDALDYRDPDVKKKILDSAQHIGLATHPYCRLHQQNRKAGYHTGAKPTNLHGSYWQLELVVGPFFEHGKEFKLQWRDSARGFSSRYKCGHQRCMKWFEAASAGTITNSPLLPTVQAADVLRALATTEEEDSNILTQKARWLAQWSHTVPIQMYSRNEAFARHMFQLDVGCGGGGMNTVAEEEAPAWSEVDEADDAADALLASIDASIEASASDWVKPSIFSISRNAASSTF